ncbi:GntR family transcriptional regulator, partial [Frankia nepalensis]|uniref:GntR family transcriptional regulator n=1 Tax=Frankia nepalensis TaxID=1836974 RepID=UPI001EE44FFD
MIVSAVDDRSARGIAGSVSRLVSAGTLPAGTRLPTVRELATELGISPTTVSQAWRTLARAGVISPRGRAGTFVLAGPPASAARIPGVSSPQAAVPVTSAASASAASAAGGPRARPGGPPGGGRRRAPGPGRAAEPHRG